MILPKRIICGMLVVAALTACFVPVVAAEQSEAAASNRIQPADTLQISVFREPDLSVAVKVTQMGTINFPLLGTVEVGGLTVAEAQKKLTNQLADGYLVNPRVSLAIERSGNRRVVVLGQVKSPGTFEMAPDESLTLLQAIARAGGFTSIAATDRISLIRTTDGKEQKITVNVAAIMRGGNRAKDMELQPGDVVSVPETLF